MTTQSTRERYTKMLCDEDVTFCTDKMRAKLWDVAVNDMLNTIFAFIEAEIANARRESYTEWRAEWLLRWAEEMKNRILIDIQERTQSWNTSIDEDYLDFISSLTL